MSTTETVIGAKRTPALPAGECSLFETLIQPAILRLLAEEEGGYRVERDLHHHLTVCLHQTAQVRLGRRDRLIRYEEPTTAKYTWKNNAANLSNGRKAGNIDFFFPAQPTVPQIGAAMEVNFGYKSIGKIQQDFIKLLDPRNGYRQAVYFAYGRKAGFKEIVGNGLTMAFEQVRAHTASFALPVALYILVLENRRRRGGMARDLWEANLSGICSLDDLIWSKIPLEDRTQYRTGGYRNREEPTMNKPDETRLEREELYISRHDAELIHASAMEKAGIPLRSTTARCMFEPTKDGHGRDNCTLGPTPLWDNCLRVVSGKVLRSEFMDWIDRLIDSGHKFQRAGRSSWASQAGTYPA